jgi:heat shock protein HslJ
MTHRRGRSAALLALCLVALAGCGTSTPSVSTPSVSPPPTPGASEAAALSGTSWVVTSVGGTTTLPDTRPTMVFGVDGQLQGTGGCNGYGGPYQLDGDAIEVGDLASTLILCEGEVGTQEAAFMAALRGATTWQITADGGLELGGASEIVAVPAGPEASGSAALGLEGGWDLVEMGPTADFAHLLPTIEFRADGSVSGFAACNTFHGSYETDGASLTLGPLATTRIGCPPPASTVEAEYLEALSGVTGWAIEPDGRLRLDGSLPLRYTRR